MGAAGLMMDYGAPGRKVDSLFCGSVGGVWMSQRRPRLRVRFCLMCQSSCAKSDQKKELSRASTGASWVWVLARPRMKSERALPGACGGAGLESPDAVVVEIGQLDVFVERGFATDREGVVAFRQDEEVAEGVEVGSCGWPHDGVGEREVVADGDLRKAELALTGEGGAEVVSEVPGVLMRPP